ncbi:MAG: hypothetical protein RLY20_154 [Verrucomicrobiota bacterium]
MPVGEHNVAIRKQLEHRIEEVTHYFRHLRLAAELAENLSRRFQFHQFATIPIRNYPMPRSLNFTAF